ncbi:MAG: SHOCT domain-containing protein [Phycisphaerales bacterium]
MPSLLAQSVQSVDVTKILVAVGVLLATVLLLAVVLLKMRRRLLADDEAAGMPLTLHDLRQLHASGAMSDEEFDRAKAALIGMAGGGARRGARPESSYPSTEKPPETGGNHGKPGGLA